MAQHVQDCHWSVPTLLMPRPYWFSAWEAPWSCWNEHQIAVLATTETCQHCPLWRQRHVKDGVGRSIPPEGAMAPEADR